MAPIIPKFDYSLQGSNLVEGPGQNYISSSDVGNTLGPDLLNEYERVMWIYG